MYCQSKLNEPRPRPSFPFPPPKIFVKTARVLGDAFTEAKQKTDIPLRVGKLEEIQCSH